MFSPEVKVDESLAMKQELLGELFKAESRTEYWNKHDRYELLG